MSLRVTKYYRALKARVAEITLDNRALLEFFLHNAPQAAVALMALSLAKVPLLAGICYTRPERLGQMIVDNNLPRNITVDITKPLANKIAVPFGQQFKALIDSMAASKDTRVPEPVKMDEPEINDLAVEDVLFEMMGEINSDPKKAEDFDSRAFQREYVGRLAGKMKEDYFQDAPITVEQIADLIRGLKIDGRKNLAQMISDWIEDNGIFGEEFSSSIATSAGGQHGAR